MHWTLGILRQSQAVSYASAFFQSDGVPPPAPARVTQTVGQFSTKQHEQTAYSFKVSFYVWLPKTMVLLGREMLFLLLSSLRLIPFIVLLSWQKSFGELKILQKSIYIICTGLFFGGVYLSIPVIYDRIFNYQMFAPYATDFVWAHVFGGILIGLLFLSSVKNGIKDEGIVPLFIGIGLIAIMLVFDRLQLLFLRDHAVMQN